MFCFQQTKLSPCRWIIIIIVLTQGTIFSCCEENNIASKFLRWETTAAWGYQSQQCCWNSMNFYWISVFTNQYFSGLTKFVCFTWNKAIPNCQMLHDSTKVKSMHCALYWKTPYGIVVLWCLCWPDNRKNRWKDFVCKVDYLLMKTNNSYGLGLSYKVFFQVQKKSQGRYIYPFKCGLVCYVSPY